VAWAGAIATIAAGVGVGFFVRQRDGDRVADVAAPHSAPTTTLAVLPFRPLAEAGGPRDEVLELGMADSLITRLSAARTVIVSPVGAVRRYAGRDADPLQAARELGVDWVLEGTIQQRGDRMRVTARLLDVRDGSAAWSDSFDQAFTHVFDVQEAISRRVADVLMPRLGERERYALGVPGTRSIETYRIYMEARYLTKLFTPDAFRRSIALYERAIADDPRYAYAYQGLADVLRRTQYTSNTPPRQTWGRIRALAERAVDIDPQYGDGLAMLGWVAFWFDWDWPRAEREFARARAEPEFDR
jgi:TolB-like protein